MVRETSRAGPSIQPSPDLRPQAPSGSLNLVPFILRGRKRGSGVLRRVRRGWGPDAVSRRLPAPQGEPSPAAEEGLGLEGLCLRGPPEGSRTPAHPCTKRWGLRLTLLPGNDPGTRSTQPPSRQGAGRGPQRGRPRPERAPRGRRGPSRASPGPLTRWGAWPPRRAARPWSRRAGGAGGARAPRVRRSPRPPPPSFTFSALTHRPPSRAGGGQRRGREDGRGWHRPGRAARGGAGAGRGRREQGAPRPRERRPRRPASPERPAWPAARVPERAGRHPGPGALLPARPRPRGPPLQARTERALPRAGRGPGASELRSGTTWPPPGRAGPGRAEEGGPAGARLETGVARAARRLLSQDPTDLQRRSRAVGLGGSLTCSTCALVPSPDSGRTPTSGPEPAQQRCGSSGWKPLEFAELPQGPRGRAAPRGIPGGRRAETPAEAAHARARGEPARGPSAELGPHAPPPHTRATPDLA